MASKQVIETNKLKIGSSGVAGLYVGSTESKYAIMTDSAKTQTVIYDKVTYNFGVTDYTGSVPASGATLTVTGSSTRTHGNGTVDTVSFSPTSVVVPANTGSSYSSSVTITQATSNLTDAYNYTVAGDVVKSISLSISNPATIPAAGGSVNTCTTAATVTYNSGRQVTSFTPTSVNFNTVSADTKGTTISDVTTAGTLTCYIVFGGVTSNTASVYVKQAANAVVSYTGYSDLAGKTISASKVPAAGGTSTISWSGTPSAKRKPVYTSTATGSSVSYTPSISTAVTGNSVVASKGTTISNETTAIATVTGYYWADGVTASTTTSVKQDGNYVTGITVASQAASIANIPASGGSKTPTGSNGTVTYAFTSTSTSTTAPASTYGTLTTEVSYAMTATGRFTLKSTSTGEVSATTKGTTIENVTNANTLTKTVNHTWTPTSSYNAAGMKTCSGTATCTPKQDGNYVTSISVASVGLSYAAILAAGGSKTPTGSNGTVTYTFSSTSTSTTAPSSTFGSLTTTPSYAMTASGRFTLKSTSTGEVSATTKGTSVEGVTSSDTITKTVNCTWTPTASYNAAGTKTASGSTTNKATQAANAITGYTDYQNPTGKSISGTQVPASGGTSTITWSGTAAQDAKAVYTSNATASTYTNVAPSVSTAITGNNTVSSKGTTESSITTAQTVTGYYWANGKTATTSCYVTQAANTLPTTLTESGTSAYTAAVSIGNGMTAAGGSATVTHSAGHTVYGKRTWTSGSKVDTAYTVSDTSTIAITSNGNNRFSLDGNTLTHSSMTTNVATDSVTVKVTNASNTGTTNTASKSISNAVTNTAYGGVTITSPSNNATLGEIAAAGGTKTPTRTATQTITYTFTSTSTSSSTKTTGFTWTTDKAAGAALGTGFYCVNDGSSIPCAISAETRGTTTGAARTSNNLTLTCTGEGSKSTSVSYYATQAKNEVVSYTEYGTPTGKSISGSQVGAAGGTSTITWSGTPAQTRKPVYSSNATGSSVSFTPTISTAITGNNAVSSKGTTVSDVTTAQTVTGYYWANGKTASTTCYVTQAANAVVSYTDYQTPTGKSISGSQVPASGGTSTITWSGTAAQNAKAVYTSNATASTYTNVAPSVSTAVTGNSAVASKGTTISNATTAIATVTGYYWANGKTASTTCSVTQAANYVTSVAASGSSSAAHFSYSNIAAGATSASPSLHGGAEYTFTSGSKKFDSSTSPSFGGSATYTRTYTIANTTTNGFTGITASSGVLGATSRGTTIGNARTSATVTGTLTVKYTHASTYSGGGSVTSAGYQTTATCTQNGNYVTSISVAGQAASIANIPAGGGSKTPTGSNGTVTYTFSSTSTSTTAPGSTYGALTSSVSYAMTATGRFTLKSTSTGEVSATSKTTSIENVTNANTLTKTVSYTWTPTASYNAAGTKTCSGTATCTPKQDGNYVTSISVASQAVSYAAIPASGGSKTDTGSDGTVTYTFTSTSTSTSAPGSTYGSLTASKSYAMTASGRFTLKSTTTGEVSATTKGTSVESVTSSDTITKTVNKTWTPTSSYNAAGTKTCSGTATGKATQAANAVTSTTWSNPSVSSYSYANIGAAGGTSNPNVSATQSGTNYYTSGSSAATSNTSFTYSYSMPTGNGFSINTSTGIITCDARGKSNTTRASNTATVTVTGSGSKTGTRTTTCTQDGNTFTIVWDNPVVTASYPNIGAAGGTSSPSISTTQSGTKTWANDAGTDALSNDQFYYTYTMTSGNGFTIATSNGVVTAEARGKSTETRTSNSITIAAEGISESPRTRRRGFTITTCTQNGNTYSDSWNNPSVTAFVYGNTIPAGGGSKTPTQVTATQSGTRTWANSAGTDALSNNSFTYTYAMTASGRFSLKSTSTGEVSATTRGTTTGSAEASPTVTVTATANGKSGTGTATCTQVANEVVSYTDYQNPTGKSISGSQVPAAGGTSTITWAGTCKQQAKAVYTSTSTASSYTNLTISSPSTTVTGNSAVSSKGTTVSNVTTALTVTGYYWANNKTASTTCYVTQAANAITSYTDYQTPTGKSISGSQVPAAGGTSTITWAGTAAQNAKPVYTSTSTGSSYVNVAPSVSTAVTGNSAVSSKGTTTSNVTTALTVTGYYWANGKTASTSCYVTQAANAIVSYTDYGTPTGKSISGSQVPAAGGTSTITWSGTPAQTRKPVYTSTSTGSSVSFTPTISTAVTGNSAVSSKGTSVSNVTTALTVTGYYWANGKTASTNCYVTQAANAIVSYTDYQNPTGKSISGSQVPASGGTSTITWSGTAAQNAKPVYTSTSTGSSYVNVAPSVSTAVTGNSAVSSKGSTTSNTTTALTVTGYYWANGKTASTSCYVTQAANAVTSTTWDSPTVNSYSYADISADGGTSNPSTSVAQTGTNYYTSGSSGGTGNSSFTYAYSMITGNGFSINTSTGAITAEARGRYTTTRVSNTATVTVTGAGSKTGTKTATCTQNGSRYSDSYGVPTINSYSYPDIETVYRDTSSGTSTPTVSAIQDGQRRWTTGGGGVEGLTNTAFTYTYSMVSDDVFTINSSSGVIAAVGMPYLLYTNNLNYTGRTSPIATVTVKGIGQGLNSASTTATCNQIIPAHTDSALPITVSSLTYVNSSNRTIMTFPRSGGTFSPSAVTETQRVDRTWEGGVAQIYHNDVFTYSYSASATDTSWFSFDTTTGVITVSPYVSGDRRVTITVTATAFGQTGTKSVTLVQTNKS